MLSFQFIFIFFIIIVIIDEFDCKIENDTIVVGSLVHEKKLKPPSGDLSTAQTHHIDDTGMHGNLGYSNDDIGIGKDGYSVDDAYHTKDGGSFGYEQEKAFGSDGDNDKQGAYHHSSSYEDDEMAGKPKYREWHYEKKSGSPAKRYSYDSRRSSKPKSYSEEDGKLVGPDYHESKKGRKPKKKELLTAATEYDNFEAYDDEGDEGAAQAEGDAEEEADPEYAALYSDAEAYTDYY